MSPLPSCCVSGAYVDLMQKKTPKQKKTARNLTSLEQDVLVSIHGGTDPDSEPAPEPDDEMLGHIVVIG